MSFSKFLKDIGFATIANILLGLKGLILLPLLTKTLGAENYGIWVQVLVTVSLLMPFALLQLEYAMTRFLAGESDKIKISEGISSIWIMVILSSSLVSLLIIILEKPITIFLFNDISNPFFIKLLASLVFLTTLDQIIFRYFISFRQMGRYFIFTIFQTVGEVSLIYFFILLLHAGLLGALISLLLMRVFLFIVGFLLIKSEIKISTPTLPTIKKYLKFSLPLIPFTCSWWLVNTGDRYVIGYFLGVAQVGIYSAAYTLGSLITFIYSPINLVLFPTITNLYSENKIHEVRLHLKYTFKFFLMIAIPSFFGLSILSRSLLNILTTAEFTEAYIVIPIVAIGALLFSMSNLFSDILMLFKKTKLISLTFGGSALINFFMNLVLVPLTGIIGAAVATLTSFVFLFFSLVFFSFKNLSFNWDPKFIIKSILSSMIMGLFILYINPQNSVGIVMCSIGGALIYFGILIIVGGFTFKEYLFLKKLLKRKFY